MSNVQYAFLERSKVPDRAAWQSAIDKCGFDFQLFPELQAFESSGFLPCKLMGSEAGFEIYYDEATGLAEELGADAEGLDYCVWFRWGGSLVECASAMIASYVLAKAFDAVVCFEGQPPYDDLDSFRQQAIAACEFAKGDM